VKRQPRLPELFKRFDNIFGFSWTSTVAGPQELLGRMLEWEPVIKDLSDDQIEKAIKKCKYTCDFITIQAFRKAALDIVPADRAWSLINKDSLATEAYNNVDGWFKKTAAEKDVKREFMANYNNLVEKLLIGDDYD
jgi:hypothetical protein